MIPYEKHLATAVKKNSLLTGRDLWEKQAQRRVAICYYRSRDDGKGSRNEEDRETTESSSSASPSVVNITMVIKILSL